MIGALRRHGRILVLCAGVQILLGWLATRAYRTGNASLAAGGNWVVGKTLAERGLMGAWSFLTGRQALAGEELRLEAWHGFHEVISQREFAGLRRLEFDFALGGGAYVVVFFHRDGTNPYAALRLSLHPRHPTAFLEVEEDGAFRAREELDAVSIDAGSRHRVRLDFESQSVVAFLDGRENSAHKASPTPAGGGR